MQHGQLTVLGHTRTVRGEPTAQVRVGVGVKVKVRIRVKVRVKVRESQGRGHSHSQGRLRHSDATVHGATVFWCILVHSGATVVNPTVDGDVMLMCRVTFDEMTMVLQWPG